MNFRPTLWKIVVSFLLTLISIWVFYVPSGSFFVNPLNLVPYLIITPWYWLPILILTYIIWSLFEKKKETFSQIY